MSYDRSNIQENKPVTIFAKEREISFQVAWIQKVLFIISGVAMTVLFSLRGVPVFTAVGVVCSFVILCVLTFKFDFLEKVFININKVRLIVSFVFALFACYQFIIAFYIRCLRLFELASPVIQIPEHYRSIIGIILAIAVGIAAFYSIYVFLYAFIDRFYVVLKDWFGQIDRIEKYYLIICGIGFAIAVVLIFRSTNVFYAPNIDGTIIDFDVVYTSDSGDHLKNNVYLIIGAGENDIRQPLFGLFALPFALVATVLSKFLFFIPNIYPIAIDIIQIVLLLVSFVSITRILSLSGATKAFLLIIFMISYPTLLFSLNMEQYIFVVFWLILFIYASVMNKESKEYYFIAATGSMMTTAITFPLLLRGKPIRECVRDLVSTGLIFAIIITIFGRLPIFLDIVASFKGLMRFAGTKIPFTEKLLQFFNFVASCFIKPQAGINTTMYSHISYQLDPVTSLNYLGVVIFAVTILGFILNYKNHFALICFGWVLFSFCILCLLGWGTIENGLILYTLYFSWAYISLVFMCIEKVFAKWKIFRYLVYSTAILVLLCINLPGIYQIIDFGIKYYPMVIQ